MNEMMLFVYLSRRLCWSRKTRKTTFYIVRHYNYTKLCPLLNCVKIVSNCCPKLCQCNINQMNILRCCGVLMLFQCMSLKVLEFIKKCLKVLKFLVILFLGGFEIVWHYKKGIFYWFDFDHVFNTIKAQSCSKLGTARDAGAMWRQGGGANLRERALLNWYILRDVCKTSEVELRLIMFSIYWMIGVRGGFSARRLCYSWSSMTAFLAFSEANS